MANKSNQLHNVVMQNNLKRNFISIEYPGRVINDQEAFRTMGGLVGK